MLDKGLFHWSHQMVEFMGRVDDSTLVCDLARDTDTNWQFCPLPLAGSRHFGAHGVLGHGVVSAGNFHIAMAEAFSNSGDGLYHAVLFHTGQPKISGMA